MIIFLEGTGLHDNQGLDCTSATLRPAATCAARALPSAEAALGLIVQNLSPLASLSRTLQRPKKRKV